MFVESASGIAEGARTGLANVVTGLLFLAAMFFTPLYEVVPVEAAAPALVIVGALMIGGRSATIDCRDFSVALPVFLTIVVMPFTYSIANGIGAGFISCVLLRTATGRAREHPPADVGRRRRVRPLLRRHTVAGAVRPVRYSVP